MSDEKDITPEMWERAFDNATEALVKMRTELGLERDLTLTDWRQNDIGSYIAKMRASCVRNGTEGFSKIGTVNGATPAISESLKAVETHVRQELGLVQKQHRQR